jgi:hypothetical protein
LPGLGIEDADVHFFLKMKLNLLYATSFFCRDRDVWMGVLKIGACHWMDFEAMFGMA